MPIQHWPESEKPREKMFHQGEHALSNAELLAILLGCGSGGKDVLSLSRDLLSHYRSLHELFRANQQSLMKQTGIGNAKYAQLKAVAELNRRYLQEPLAQDSLLVNSKRVKDYLVAEMRAHQKEVFSCLFLDVKFRLLRFEKLFNGTVSSATVHPREVVKRALELNASAMIVCHNHPSGDPQPSLADQRMTDHLVKVLQLIEVQLVDHIIVAGHQTLSFAEQGLL